MSHDPRHISVKGRGAVSNVAGRFESYNSVLEDDGWGSLEPLPENRATSLEVDSARTVISRHDSPDLPFRQSVNMYRGCEHGCIYCFARPSHAWLGLSPGLDFETRLFYKPDAPALLRKDLARRAHVPTPLALGANTDPYQPVERPASVMREILQVLSDCNHPVAIVTKGSLVERDIDILSSMAERNLAQATLSVTSLDSELSRRLEPRATAPARRLKTIRKLHEASIPVAVFMAPVIPVINHSEIEAIASAVHETGALDFTHTILRLPREVAELFEQWLHEHYPQRAEKVLGHIRSMRDGALYRSDFGERMTGTGPLAKFIADRVTVVRRRLAFSGVPPLDQSQFVPPRAHSSQLSLVLGLVLQAASLHYSRSWSY
jgi:DNA repair photolyase